MLSKYIKNLLDVHSRVIVPDLGAFMLKGDASKTIYFNEFLRFNDGLLVDSVAEQEQVDKIEAAKKVKNFVDNINKQLSDNKLVVLEGLGTLYLDINEKIQLRISDAPVQPVKQPETETETSPREILFELEKTETESAQKAQIPVSPPSPPVAPVQKSKQETQTQSVKTTKTKAKQLATSQVNEEKEQTAQKEVPIEVAHTTTTKRMVFVALFGIFVIGTIVYFAFFRSPKKDTNVNQNITIGANAKKDSTASAKKDTFTKETQKAVVDKPQIKAPVELKKKEEVKAQPSAKIAENKPKPVAAPISKKRNS